MALLIRSIRNESATPIVLRIPGFDPTSAITLLPGVTVDLLPLITLDEFQALQAQLASLVAAGELSTQATVNSSDLVGTVDAATLLPAVAATVNALAVSADVTNAVLFTPTVTGMYSVSVYAVCTASATGGDVGPSLLVGWTDESGFNQNYVATPLGANATLISYATFPVWDIATNPIVYTLSGGAYSTLRYDLHFVVEHI